MRCKSCNREMRERIETERLKKERKMEENEREREGGIGKTEREK